MGDKEFEVAKIAVAPEHRGKGIGRLLLSAAIREAERLGAKRLYLETNQILTPAIALYESLGSEGRPYGNVLGWATNSAIVLAP